MHAEGHAQAPFDRADNTARLALELAEAKREAADLRAENDALRLEVGDWINDQADKVARLADAEAEIERLRGTLEAANDAVAEAAVERAEAAEDALRTLRERVAGLADEVDEWTPYDSRDTGETFLADSVREFVSDLRAALADAPAEATPPAECGAKHPTNSSVVPCVRDEGHEGLHMSTTGCAGSVMHWAATPPAEQRAEP